MMHNVVLRSTWVILRSRWHVAYNVFLRGGLLRKIGAGLIVLVGLVAMYGLFRFSRFAVTALRLVANEEPQLLPRLGDVERLLGVLPSIAFTSIAIPLLISSVSFALGALYLATDLDLLLVSPAPMRAVFLARFAEGLLPTYLFLFVLLLPSLVGYGVALRYGWTYFGTLPLVLLLLPLLPMSVGVLLTMALARVVPPRRLRELLAVLGGLFGFAVYLGSQMLTRQRSFATSATTERLLALDVAVLPTSWASQVLGAAGRGDAGIVLRYGVPYALVTLGLFGLTVFLTERLYYAGWIGLAGTVGGRVRRARRGAWRVPVARGAVAAIMAKDLRTLPRDPQRLSQLLFPLALSGFWVWQLLSMRGVRFGGGVVVSLTTITLLVCLLITSNLGLTSLSREGTGFWQLHLAPIGPWPLLWAKWAVAFLPFPIIATLFTVLVAVLRDPPTAPLLRALLATVLTGVGVSGIATGAGAAFPRFDWSQAQRMTSLRAGCIAPVLYYLYAGTMLMLTLGVETYLQRPNTALIIAGWSVALVLTACALCIPLRVAAARLRRLEL
jgi:ABC-2 type transport system permease protein